AVGGPRPDRPTGEAVWFGCPHAGTGRAPRRAHRPERSGAGRGASVAACDALVHSRRDFLSSGFRIAVIFFEGGSFGSSGPSFVLFLFFPFSCNCSRPRRGYAHAPRARVS